MSDCVERQAVIETALTYLVEYCGAALDEDMQRMMKERLDSLSSAQPLVLPCDGCKFIGTYDTSFPCSVCIRREKDYYEQER